MKVRMKIRIAGSRNGIRWPEAGEVVDLPNGEAAELCAAGLATPEADKKPEKAVAPKPESRKG